VELERVVVGHDPLDVGHRDQGVVADPEQALHAALAERMDELDRRDAGERQLGLWDAPVVGHERAVLGVLDVTSPRELVGLLPVLPPALAVALAGDRPVSLARRPELAGREHQVDHGERVLHAERLVLDATGVEGHRSVRVAPQRAHTLHERGVDAADLRRALGGVGANDVADGLPAHRELGNEGIVQEPAALDHVEHAVQERRIGPGPERDEHIGCAGDRGLAWIEDHELRLAIATGPHVVRHHRKHSATLAPAIRITSVSRMSDQGLAARSIPNAFLLAAAALTMHSRPL
jgi:hypothetical protein